ncbi:MAG: sensor histidine kinase [Aquabacterium sp.]|nr:MAG: sensor histidine kinase [Aquabacterium sp.]
MSARTWPSWGIAARLLAIAVLPASIMFVAVTGALYLGARGEVQRDVAERGRLIATALAQSSQYALVSGNSGYLRTTLRSLQETDPSIVCISITDDTGQLVASDCPLSGPSQYTAYEAPVRIPALPDVDLLDPGEGPEHGQHPPAAGGMAVPPASSPLPALRTVGQVRVLMSAATLLKAKQRTLLASSALVLGAGVISCLVGLRLAGRLRRTLGSVMSALRAMRRGSFDVEFDSVQPGELGELQRTILQMSHTIATSQHELEQQVESRTRELQQAVDHVRQADAEKRRLIVHSNARVEDDRRRIALDLHDHLGAALISVRLEAAALLAKAEAAGDAEAARGAQRIFDTAESLYSSTRSIVKSLRPEAIDTLGLAGALEDMVHNLDKPHTGCSFEFNVDRDWPDLRGEAAMPAFRVVQEALNNAVKHAQATRVSVDLTLDREHDRLRIVVSDDGLGFDPDVMSHTGFGLIGMRERVAAVGGEMSITSKPGSGTRVSLSLRRPRAAGS